LNYLLDTCVISELVRPTPNEAVINWMSHLPNERLFLSVITIGEIRKGITNFLNQKRKISSQIGLIPFWKITNQEFIPLI